MHLHYSFLAAPTLLVVFALLMIAFLSVKAHKLTPKAGFTGFATGCLIYFGGGLAGVLELSAFFVMGVLASRYKHKTKFAGTQQDTAEARSSGQVMANAGVAAIMAMLALLLPQHAILFRLMLAGSLASATADTLASELGVVFSKRFYNCLTFKPDVKGRDGVISLEGLFFGAAGALLIGFIYVGLSPAVLAKPLLMITLTGTAGNYMDSVLGATLERKNYLSNNSVNFLNTLFAALCILVLSYWLG